jgi:hypothetical protein
LPTRYCLRIGPQGLPPHWPTSPQASTLGTRTASALAHKHCLHKAETVLEGIGPLAHKDCLMAAHSASLCLFCLLGGRVGSHQRSRPEGEAAVPVPVPAPAPVPAPLSLSLSPLSPSPPLSLSLPLPSLSLSFSTSLCIYLEVEGVEPPPSLTPPSPPSPPLSRYIYICTHTP